MQHKGACPVLEFGRELCGDLASAGSREWLVTNGIGGYAAGTIAGLLTRRYHGLLVAAVQPPVVRILLLTSLDEMATYGDRDYPLFAHRRAGREVEPAGYSHLESFGLEGTTPVWTFALADALLEKRVWMQPGANTTYVRYTHRRGSGPLALRIEALVNHRDHHHNTLVTEEAPDWTVGSVPHGLRVGAGEDRTPLYLFSEAASATPRARWRRGFFLGIEDYRGLDPLDDNFCAGCFEATLAPGQSMTLVASTDAGPNLDGASAYEVRLAAEERLLAQARPILDPGTPAIARLVLAADQFVVDRALPDGSAGKSVIAGYPWFSDWGRDTMISLPGLALATGRYDVAARILSTFAHHVDQGMLPNRFPDEGQAPEYNTVDATLWYFEAIRATHAATGDDGLLRDLFPILAEIVAWHRRGTRYQIHVDPGDGLLYAGEEGVQLTWMDAKVDDWVVTPRTGKAVEINALWYNALRTMAGFARHLGADPTPYDDLAGRVLAGFARFWNPGRGCCYDVLDGPRGADPALRPNQLLAVSLPHSPLQPARQRAVVDVCARHLLTSHGLRSLAPDDPGYIGHYGGSRRARDAAYHQGTAWGWLIGPFVRAHLRVFGDPAAARSFLEPLLRHMAGHGVGSLSEIFDGDPPFTPRGCFAQAWTVAEVLAAWQAIQSLA